MRRSRSIAAVRVGVMVLAGAATSLVAFRDTADPVTVDEAVTSFRTGTEPAASGPSPIPEGVRVTLRAHAEHGAAVYPLTWHEVA